MPFRGQMEQYGYNSHSPTQPPLTGASLTTAHTRIAENIALRGGNAYTNRPENLTTQTGRHGHTAAC